MSRFKLTIEYDGTRYQGWQLQKAGRTVQGEILEACRELFGKNEVEVYGAGRTDSGVHAIAQAAHLEVDTGLSPLRIRYGINDRLPSDICIKNVEAAHNKFHARHDASARSYIYQVSRRRTAFGKKFVWWIRDELDMAAMKEAAEKFTGFKDYRYFTDEDNEQASTKVEILHSDIHEYGDLLVFHVIGSHFLWKQVRRMTGVLVEAGRGRLSPADIPSFFRIKTDVPARLTAPPSGLFLEKVYYRNEDLSYEAQPLMII